MSEGGAALTFEASWHDAPNTTESSGDNAPTLQMIDMMVGSQKFFKRAAELIGAALADLDVWIHEYNEARLHQGRWCFGKTPMQPFLDAMPMMKEKMIAA